MSQIARSALGALAMNLILVPPLLANPLEAEASGLDCQLEAITDFWQAEIEGPLHSVRFCHRKMLAPGEWQNQVGEFHLH